MSGSQPQQAPLPLAMRNPVFTTLGERLGINPGEISSVFFTACNMPKDTSAQHMLAFAAVCNEYQLNPLLRQIYAFPSKTGGIQPIVGIDGWLAIMNRHPQYDGHEVEFTDDENGKPLTVKVTIWRKDRTHPTVVREYFRECKRDTAPWNGNPHRMLSNRGLAQGARQAFGITGIYISPEEIGEAEPVEVIGNVAPGVTVEQPKRTKAASTALNAAKAAAARSQAPAESATEAYNRQEPIEGEAGGQEQGGEEPASDATQTQPESSESAAPVPETPPLSLRDACEFIVGDDSVKWSGCKAQDTADLLMWTGVEFKGEHKFNHDSGALITFKGGSRGGIAVHKDGKEIVGASPKQMVATFLDILNEMRA